MQTPTPRAPTSILALDVGHVWTRALLIERVAGIIRFVASGEAPTTHEDVVPGAQIAVKTLEANTGRRLLDADGTPLSPEQDGAGVDLVVVTSSAGPPLKVAVGGMVEQISAASARRAALAVPSEIADQFVLDSPVGRWGNAEGATGVVERLLRRWPDAVVLAGGTEGSADRALLELVDAVRLAVEARPEQAPPTLIFAGNSALHDEVREAVGEVVPLHLSPNIRPTLDDERTREVGRLLDQQSRALALRRVPGLDILQQWGGREPLSHVEALARTVQYLALRGDGAVLGLDLGGEDASLAVTFRNRVTQTLVRTDLGVPSDAARLLEMVGAEQLIGWVPGLTPADDLLNHLLNLSLWPAQRAATPEAVRVLHAAAREAMRLLLDEARAAWPGEEAHAPRFDTVLIGGSVARSAPRPEQALMMVLDTVQPVGITEVLRDRAGLIPAIGALAEHAPQVAAELVERQGLERLAAVVTPFGGAGVGEEVLHFRLTQGGAVTEGAARAGQLYRFPVLGETRLELLPRADFDVGFGPGKGVELTGTDDSVGLVIDARGRPLVLPDGLEARRRFAGEWLRYAGA
ncbi:MAG TPA: glutamate mutase L [Ardenticatenaceae bacterium]